MKNKLADCLRPLLLGALLFTAAAGAEVRPLDRVAAIVDGDVIMQSQLEARLREVQQTIGRRGAALPPEHVLTQQVLERLIIENIQLQIGERSGIRIGDAELNEAMASIAQRNGLSEVSMGMSADFPVAVQFGSTLVRIGAAIFGERGREPE